jgi:hypothetical protein
MGIRSILGAVTALAVMAVSGCVPDAPPATTDTLHVDGGGTWSEPARDVMASFSRNSCSGSVPETTEFLVAVMPGGSGWAGFPGDLVKFFSMKRNADNGYTSYVPLPAPGTYTWGPQPGQYTTSFALGDHTDYPGAYHVGSLVISAITLEEVPNLPPYGEACRPRWDVTYLRATFFVTQPNGTFTGSIRIG